MTNGKVISILLVEDNEGDARLAMEAMSDAKVKNEVVWVEDGVDALEFLRREGKFKNAELPDVILLDLNLPRMDGREVLKVIKTMPVIKRIPVVILTTSKDEKDILESYDLHANCFITKPLDLDGFLEVVRTIEDFWLTIVKLPNEKK